MKWQMGNRLVLGGFAIATAILIFVGWQSYRSTGLFVDAAHWRDHTYEVLNSLDETVGQLSDAETGQRGYLLTGDETYLEPYRAAIKTVDQAVAYLKNLTADNPNQLAKG
jgi:methyl-accepting chemotaxis protein